MKITTFEIKKYRNCSIYIRNFKNHFEYLTLIDNQLYTSHITVIPHWITRIICFVTDEKLPYSQQQLKAILIQVQRLAETTIDFVLDKGTGKAKK